MVSLFERYHTMILATGHDWPGTPDNPKVSADNVLTLCEEVIKNAKNYPYDKLNRWLGFVQGVLACNDIIYVDRERDYTRPLFHKLHPAPSFDSEAK